MILAVPSSPAEFQGVFLLGVQHVAAYTLSMAKAMVLTVCLFVFCKARNASCEALLAETQFAACHADMAVFFQTTHIGMLYRLADC